MSNMVYNEQAIRNLYKILGHTGYWSRIGSLDCTSKQYEDTRLFGINPIIEYARKWNGLRNIFIGRNPRNKDGSVIGSYCITFDVDSIRTKGEAASDEQHSNALNAGRKILGLYNGGILCSSGNGCLLLYPCEIGRSSLDVYYKKEAIFIRQLQEMVEQSGIKNVKIDSTSYEEAVIKLIGTQSTKGELRLRRLSRFLTIPGRYFQHSILMDEIYKIEIKETISTEKFKGDPVQRMEEAQQALKQLPNTFLNDYDCWVKVGMALKEFGIAGLSLWKEWSKNGKTYKEGECEEKWGSFNETPEVTLGSLRFWSKRTDNQSISLSNSDYFIRLFQTDSKYSESIFTGIRSLDSVLRALPKGEITTIAARSGFGKTSLACSCAEFLRREGRRVLYFSTELSKEYLMHKLVSCALGISQEKLIQKSFSENEGKRIREYEQELLQSSIEICDEFQPTIEQVKQKASNYRPDLLVFDHVSQVSSSWQDVANFMKGLKLLTTETGCVTLVLSQLNEPGRNSKGEENTSIRGDVRGSQEIIFLSGIFMFITNPYEVKTEIQPVEIHIAKNRYGISGQTVGAEVNKLTGRFQ